MTGGTLNIGQAMVSQLVDDTLTVQQKSYLDSLPDDLRQRVYAAVGRSLGVSARMQLIYCSQVGIGQAVLERLVKTEQTAMEMDQGRDALAYRLVQCGASLPLLVTLLGMDKQTFTHIRKILGLSGSNSRKCVGDEESVHIYRLWEGMGKPTDVEGFLGLHEASGQSLHILWGLVQDWQHAQQQRGKASRKAVGW